MPQTGPCRRSASVITPAAARAAAVRTWFQAVHSLT